MTKALDAAVRAICQEQQSCCEWPKCKEACAFWGHTAKHALSAALHVMPPEDVIEDAIEAASEYISSTWRGSKAWDTKEYAIAQVAAQAAYHILRAQILGEDV